jgi:hypothetical protein
MKRIACLVLAACAAVGGCKPSVENTSSGEAAELSGVILLRYSPGSESTAQREEGFLDTLT